MDKLELGDDDEDDEDEDEVVGLHELANDNNAADEDHH